MPDPRYSLALYGDSLVPQFDDELAAELAEQFEWDNPYDGAFLYHGDDTLYEGLTILDHPHIDGRGSVSAMCLYNHE